MFAGTAGSVPSARRGMPALLVRRGAERILIDCGEGTQRQLLQAGGLSDVTDVFITHLHVDHWLGLPGMLQTFSMRDRERALTIHGPNGLDELMRSMRRIYGRLTNAYLFVQTGGPHVIFGRGLSCPDDAISAYLANGTLPSTRITVCAGAVADPYAANPLPKAASYRSASAFATSVEQQLLNTDDYNYRYDYTTRMRSGCDFGGTMTYRPSSTGTRVDLVGCILTKGLPMTGSASLADDGSFILTVKISGQSLHYQRSASGRVTVSGTFAEVPAVSVVFCGTIVTDAGTPSSESTTVFAWPSTIVCVTVATPS